ncbi:hypothetical protein [Parvibaculum sp.]|jgi:hypothetical protein|uniref:hypothetical protein n=1 Tax=Parvibaculum sp. TaxID=2024848 RepID=UPI00329688A6
MPGGKTREVRIVRPVSRKRDGYNGFARADRAAAWTNFKADTGNFHMLHYRHVDGFFISAKNSGTQWFTFMLSHALAEQYGVEAPQFSSGPGRDAIIGPAKQKPVPGVPKIAVSHTIPSVMFSWRLMHALFEIPRCVVLVRDIRHALESIYVKWMNDLPAGEGMSLTDYVEGDPWQNREHADIWWSIQFFNHWGDVLTACPERNMLLRYEDAIEAPGEWVAKAARHYGIELTPAAIAAAEAVSSREAVRARLDPDAPKAVSDEDERASVHLSEKDEKIMRRILSRHMRYDFGYDWF